MEQIKRVAEVILEGMTKRPAELAERISREKHEIVRVDFSEERSFLLVTKTGDPTSQGDLNNFPDDCTLDKEDVSSLHAAGKILLSFLEVRKPKPGSSDVVYASAVWSKCRVSSILLYVSALRIWGKISLASPAPRSINSLLDAYSLTNKVESENFCKVYTCPQKASSLEVQEDVMGVFTYKSDVEENCYVSVGRAASKRLFERREASRVMIHQALSILVEKDIRSSYGPIGAHVKLPDESDNGRPRLVTLRDMQKPFIKNR